MNVQLKVIRDKCILMEGGLVRGDVLWVKPDRARHLIENGICAYVGERMPAEQPETGPTEAKPAGPSEVKKKPSGSLTPGRSTALASSSAPGPAKPSFASAAVLVHRERW